MTIEGLGKKFQEARLARGLTLDEAARLTKIRPSRLAEIEADDFSQFPSLAYAKGFLLIYGKFLDVDVTPYMDAFETASQGVTVDGYSYLQEEPAPKPRRVRPAPVVRERRSSSSGSRSPMPLIIAIVAIVVGFVLMKLILDIQRIGPHTEQMVGVPQPNETPIPPTVVPPPAPAPKSTAVARAPVVELPSATPKPTVVARATVAETPKIAQRPTAAPSIAIPEAFVPAFANANPVANSSVAPTATTAPSKQPEVRRAEPVRPEELAKAEAADASSETTGQNRIAIKPLKKTYIKVVVDNGKNTPVLERWISPTDKPIEVTGQHVAVRVLERDAIQIRKNGKPISADDDDITVE
jgi:cytoskeletal protein RodZ